MVEILMNRRTNAHRRRGGQKHDLSFFSPSVYKQMDKHTKHTVTTVGTNVKLLSEEGCDIMYVIHVYDPPWSVYMTGGGSGD